MLTDLQSTKPDILAYVTEVGIVPLVTNSEPAWRKSAIDESRLDQRFRFGLAVVV